MLHKLFVYGSLKDPEIQVKVIGRKIEGTPDTLVGYKKDTVELHDSVYPALVPEENGKIEGLILEVSNDEFIKLDEYETDAYKRIVEKSESGEEVYVYVLNRK